MEKIRKNFYLRKDTSDLLREYSYKTRKSQSQIVEEAIESLKKKYEIGGRSQ